MITFADLFGGQIVQLGSESYRLKYSHYSLCLLSDMGIDTNDPKTMSDASTIAKLIWVGCPKEIREVKTWEDISLAMPINAINDLINEVVKKIKDAFQEAQMVETPQSSKKKLH